VLDSNTASARALQHERLTDQGDRCRAMTLARARDLHGEGRCSLAVVRHMEWHAGGGAHRSTSMTRGSSAQPSS
jgi:hypothetical protein